MIEHRKTIMLANINCTVANAIVEDVGPRLVEVIEASRSKALNRYNIKESRIFGRPGTQERYRILRISGNNIVYKDLHRDRVDYADVDVLVERWNNAGVVEITPVDSILDRIKKLLEPLLGIALTAALISWLLNKLR
jgi:hypothetical protein